MEPMPSICEKCRFHSLAVFRTGPACARALQASQRYSGFVLLQHTAPFAPRNVKRMSASPFHLPTLPLTPQCRHEFLGGLPVDRRRADTTTAEHFDGTVRQKVMGCGLGRLFLLWWCCGCCERCRNA